jgi:hypothetical protein
LGIALGAGPQPALVGLFGADAGRQLLLRGRHRLGRRIVGARGGGGGPYRLAIIPIGAYEPRDFMKTNHIDPGEAVRIHRRCGRRCRWACIGGRSS